MAERAGGAPLVSPEKSGQLTPECWGEASRQPGRGGGQAAKAQKDLEVGTGWHQRARLHRAAFTLSNMDTRDTERNFLTAA